MRRLPGYSPGNSSVIEAVTSYSPDPPLMEPLITNISRQGINLTIDFTAPLVDPLGAEKARLSSMIFRSNRTPQTDFSEVSSGNYRVMATIVGSPTRRFFRIGR